jgi:spermidine synthase
VARSDGVVAPVDLGLAEFVPDPRRRNGWTLLIDGVAQSYVDLDDPGHLEFDYVRRVAAVARVVAPMPAPIEVLHLGGGGWTMPRYLAAARPGSRQFIVERDAALARLVASMLPLRDNARADITVEIADAREAVRPNGLFDAGRFDLVIGDIFVAAHTPRHVTGADFAHDVAQLLRPDGLYAVNLTDMPPLVFSRSLTATLRSVFADVGILGAPGMLRGRRFGNVVLAATPGPKALPHQRLGQALVKFGASGRVLHKAALDLFVADARPIGPPPHQAAPATSPPDPAAPATSGRLDD